MKKIIAFLAFAAILIIACQSKSNNFLGNPNDAVADEYTININTDTTLVTKNGALLKIPKGSLESSSSSVTLEIKEAYSIEQMIRTGLTTQAGDGPLSSGGMIYINAKGGQEVKIKEAIKVALPASFLDPNMQLFKGEIANDGSINWNNPTPLPENTQLTAIDKGQQLFESKCASCHAIGKDVTGPNLAHILKRFQDPLGEEGGWAYFEHGYRYFPEDDYSGIYTITKDSLGKEKRIYDDDFYSYHPYPFNIYKCNLVNQFGGIIGPIFFRSDTSNHNESDLLSVLHYIQNESDNRALPLPDHAVLLECADSCANYQQKKFELGKQKEEIQQKRNKLVKESPQLTEEIKIKNGTVPEPPADFDDLVSPENNKGVYYQFTIETFGWYNIDILLSTQYGNIESELFVRLAGEYREKFDIFLIIPSSKIYVKGGKSDDQDKYAFGFKNGKIFLPQNAKAYIMAVSENSSSVQFALKEFTTSQQQTLEIELKSASKEEFNAAISTMNTTDLKISVKDTKNADSIRKTDNDLKSIETELRNAENLKPKGCDCDCGTMPVKDFANATPAENSMEVNSADVMQIIE